jgi:DNA-binding GntR family transcriptional regulator
MDEERKGALEGKKLTLTNQIYQEIKNDIAKKQFQPGEKLNIKELARKYNVSDTPVKQALQRLADEKLVVNTPNKGMSVYLLTPDELNDIFDMRLMMDNFFVKDIVSTLNYNNSLRQQLVENLEEQKRFVQNSESSLYPEKYFAMDLEFHTLYLTASGNQKAVDVFTNLQPFTYATGTYLNQPHYRDCECVAEHEEILKAAFNGDLDALTKAVQVHIENSRRALQLIFKVNQIVQPNE